jgi:hypothetical protein
MPIPPAPPQGPLSDITPRLRSGASPCSPPVFSFRSPPGTLKKDRSEDNPFFPLRIILRPSVNAVMPTPPALPQGPFSSITGEFGQGPPLVPLPDLLFSFQSQSSRFELISSYPRIKFLQSGISRFWGGGNPYITKGDDANLKGTACGVPYLLVIEGSSTITRMRRSTGKVSADGREVEKIAWNRN